MNKNADSISILRSKMESFCRNQKLSLPDELEALKRSQNAKGELRSGATIKMCSRLLEDYLDERGTFFLETVKELPFVMDKDLERDLVGIFEKYIPVDFYDLRDAYFKMVNLASGNNARALNAGLELAEVSNNRVREHTNLELKQILHLIASSNQVDGSSRSLLYVEIVLFAITIFLAGMWASNPAGNFEPWVAMLGVCAAAIEVLRRFAGKPA